MAKSPHIDTTPSGKGAVGAPWLTRVGPPALILGVAGSVFWSILLAAPSEPRESCQRKFGIQQGDVTTDHRTFPPSMTCTFEDVPGQGTITLDYISQGEQVFLTAGMVTLAFLVLGGLALTAAKWFQPAVAGSERRDAAVSVRWRRMPAHLALVAALGFGVTGFGPAVVVVAGIFGDYFSLFAAMALILVCSIATATTLDRRLGPIGDDLAGSRRRGVALAATGCFASSTVAFYMIELDVMNIYDVPSLPTVLLASTLAVFWSSIAGLEWLLVSESEPPH